MRTRRHHPRGLAPVTVAMAAVALLLWGCDGGGFLLEPRQSWVAIDPVQCLTNPWEKDWLERHDGNYGSYPLDPDSQYAIIRAYYAGHGVRVDDIISIPKYQNVCEACSCPRGDALYLLVRNVDVNRMLRFGFRLESPYRDGPCDPQIEGMYRYTGFDSTGRVLVTGTLSFTLVDSHRISGTWALDCPPGYGPQNGRGELAGWIEGNVLTVNLNPEWADNNVYLYGRIADGVYRGRWDYSTFIGSVRTGTFEAVKMYQN